MEPTSTNEESKALTSILGKPEEIATFFDTIYQKECKFFAKSTRFEEQTILRARSVAEAWNEEKVMLDPYGEAVGHGWDILLNIMDENRPAHLDAEPDSLSPIFLKDQAGLVGKDREVYQENPYAAFLDGCSVVSNHSDRVSPWIAALCDDLQLSFPHAYANTYWTPPDSQAVPAHADDRDVLIIQIVGEKNWKVYKNVPVQFPYPDEQVGKGEMIVPPEVLNSETVFRGVMRPGDVLYMPRGFVHEAISSPTQSSFHITIALATHDWTLAGAISSITEKTLKQNNAFRQGLPRSFGRQFSSENLEGKDRSKVEAQIKEATSAILDHVSLDRVHNDMNDKLRTHNANARRYRSRSISKANGQLTPALDNYAVVGREASSKIFWTSLIRVATEEEKALARSGISGAVGLNVKPESADTLINILRDVKQRDVPFSARDISLMVSSDKKNRVCDGTILCFVRQCVELGALAITGENANRKRKS